MLEYQLVLYNNKLVLSDVLLRYSQLLVYISTPDLLGDVCRQLSKANHWKPVYDLLKYVNRIVNESLRKTNGKYNKKNRTLAAKFQDPKWR